ncbi:porin [Burkholderia ambifaria]|uniref:porin n=1 Tax=Burkholderia ambifaria TaxID=152480 RepID=UPI000F810189|nr:porin [Burkholderia ambifaria]UEP25812.1 porin [Burkholderia ambifaria]WAS58529.1 porin [Burkholderia ambifaria]WDR97735.1 porin [Burkholderia ambifaria]
MRKVAVAVLLGALAGAAQAQSSVTLFGRIGGGVRWVNGLTGGSQVGFNNNMLSGNDFGLHGKEDLGGGLTALFVLDGAFNSGTGALKTAGTLFSQAAYVGLSGNFGRVTFGRQFNAAEDLGIALDPLGGRGQSLAVEPGVQFDGNFFTLDSRFNNTVKYLGQAGGLRFGASYSPGGVAGNTRAGTNFSAAAMYSFLNVLGGVSYAKTYSPDGTQSAQTIQGGGTLQLGRARFYASYAALAVKAAKAGAPTRRDDIPSLGVVVQATPFVQLTAAGFYDIARNLGNVSGAGGHKLTTYAAAEYFLSKRTELYVEVDRNGVTGAYMRDPATLAALGLRRGASATTGVSVGLMTRF